MRPPVAKNGNAQMTGATQRGRQPAALAITRGDAAAAAAGRKRRERAAASAYAQHGDDGKMDEKLILAVFHYPELYNASVPKYRCAESRINAWRNISSIVGLPCECL